MLAAICCIDALNIAVFASLEAFDFVRTDTVRLAIWKLMDSTMVCLSKNHTVTGGI